MLAACGGASSHASAPEPALDCTPSTGQGVLRGMVVDAKTRAPVQTSVMLKSACSSRPARYAIVDDRGAYVLAELPADTYDVFVAGSVRTTPARVRISPGSDITIAFTVERQ
jgi:hypothetical protein